LQQPLIFLPFLTPTLSSLVPAETLLMEKIRNGLRWQTQLLNSFLLSLCVRGVDRSSRWLCVLRLAFDRNNESAKLEIRRRLGRFNDSLNQWTDGWMDGWMDGCFG
jgi:hypothetical protein